MSSIISGMWSVAFGYRSAGAMPTAAASSKTAAVYFSAISSGLQALVLDGQQHLVDRFGRASSVMCPTSVMFMICVTR